MQRLPTARLLLFASPLLLQCATAVPPYAERVALAETAVTRLQDSEFAGAREQAEQVLLEDATNPQAHIVLAITSYKLAMHDLVSDIFTLGAGLLATELIGFGGFNERYARWAITKADERFAVIERHLATAAQEPQVALELCLACWENDWNRDGVIDERDRRMLQVEIDADGREYDDDDPRRRPTFRFDLGDVYWARAMIAFQRAAFAIALAYDYGELQRTSRAARRASEEPFRVTIRLRDEASIHKARELIGRGLEHADAARKAYLAETDDDREWVPNPRQKSHPLPLPVDAKLYETWAAVVADLHKLLRGEEGLSVEELAQLGDDQWEDPPRGFLHVGNMLSRPGDIVLDQAKLERTEARGRKKEDVEAALTDLLGDKYVPQMKPSRLVSRLARMKGEVERGEESLERKLRYLFWLN